MLFALIYLLLRRLVGLIAGPSNDLHNDIEILVLRHQLMVLKRGVGRPRLRRRDRLFMAAVSGTLPRPRWLSFVVSPQTLLRWHRELVRKKWSYRRSSTGGLLPITGEVQETHPSNGQGEPSVGMPQDPRRARQARHQGLGDEDSHPAAAKRPRPGSQARWSLLERVPQVPSPRDHGSRLFRRRDGLALRRVCALRHRARVQAGSPPWCHAKPLIRRGSPSRPGTWRWGSSFRRYGSCCGTATRSSPVRSTRSSAPKVSGSSALRSGHRRRTRSPNDG